jgi:hypothetical protein
VRRPAPIRPCTGPLRQEPTRPDQNSRTRRHNPGNLGNPRSPSKQSDRTACTREVKLGCIPQTYRANMVTPCATWTPLSCATAASDLPSSTRSRVVLWHLPDQRRASRVFPASVCAPLRPSSSGTSACPDRWRCRVRVQSGQQARGLAAPRSGGEDGRRRVRADPTQARTVLSTRIPGRRQPSRDGLVFVTVAVLRRQSTPATGESSRRLCSTPGCSISSPRKAARLPSVVGNKPYRVCERVQLPKRSGASSRYLGVTLSCNLLSNSHLSYFAEIWSRF